MAASTLIVRALLPAAVAAAALLPAPASAAPKGDKPVRLVWLAPEAGPEAVVAREVRLGVQTAVDAHFEFGPKALLDDAALPVKDDKLAATFAALRKDAPAFVLAYLPDGRVGAVEAAAEKAKLPLLVLSPEMTRPDRDPKRAVFWAGGLRPTPEALQAMDLLYLPLGCRFPYVYHDGSERAVQVASKCLKLHHAAQTPTVVGVLPGIFGKAEAEALAKSGADGVVYFGGPAGAERLLSGANAAGLEMPILLGQGLGTSAVPTFLEGVVNAWALEARYMEDEGGPAQDGRYHLEDAAKAANVRLLAPTVRGFRAGFWLLTALSKSDSAKAKDLLPALRELNRPSTRGKEVFEFWGHASLARLEVWRSTRDRDDPPCHRVRNTLLPMQGMPAVGFFRSDLFEWEPGTQHVYCHYGEGEGRTIEQDLAVLGLGTKGYEADLEKRIVDDLLGRVMSKANQLFLREPDGSPIPGVSYKVTFSAKPPSDEVKTSRRSIVWIAHDDPDAGGRAFGNLAKVFSTFIRRTMYEDKKLVPALSASDRPFIVGAYKWGSALETNLREGYIRSLVDGYSQGMALTTAHELGHTYGPNHDTVTPRSIMNVVEAEDLDWEWAHWIPDHHEMLETRLGIDGE